MEKYIPKSALVAEIEKLLFSFIEKSQKLQKPQFTLMGKIDVLEDLLRILNTLEVKEVDLEKEISNYLDNHNLNIQDGGRIVFNNGDTPNLLCDFRDIAKHFFELGLKTKEE